MRIEKSMGIVLSMCSLSQTPCAPCTQVEEKALEKEKDKASQERLGEVQREIGELQDELRPLQMRYRQVGGYCKKVLQGGTAGLGGGGTIGWCFQWCFQRCRSAAAERKTSGRQTAE